MALASLFCVNVDCRDTLMMLHKQYGNMFFFCLFVYIGVKATVGFHWVEFLSPLKIPEQFGSENVTRAYIL